MKVFILILCLVGNAYAGSPTYGGSEQVSNALCSRITYVYGIYNRHVKCSHDDGDYKLTIWSSRETEKIDFYMARAIFYESHKLYPLMEPKSVRVTNNYGASNKRSLKDLVREFGK